MHRSNQPDEPAFDVDQLESVLGKKKEKSLAIERSRPTKRLERHLMVRASRCHMLAGRCFPNRRPPPTQLLTPAFNSPADTNDPANVRHGGPVGPWGRNSRLVCSSCSQAPRELSFSKVTEREGWGERDPNRISTNGNIYACESRLESLSEEILLTISNHLSRIRPEKKRSSEKW